MYTVDNTSSKYKGRLDQGSIGSSPKYDIGILGHHQKKNKQFQNDPIYIKTLNTHIFVYFNAKLLVEGFP